MILIIQGNYLGRYGPTYDQIDTENKILKQKAHEKSLAAVSDRGQPGSKSAQSSGRDSLPAKSSAKSRHNKCQRELYRRPEGSEGAAGKANQDSC